MSNNSNNNKRKKLESRRNNIIERLLFRTSEQMKQYCKLLDNEKKQDLYQKVLKEMRKNPEINQLKKLNEVAAAIHNYHKEGEK